MLGVGTATFLLIPNGSNKRVLYPGKVVESEAIQFAAEFDEAINSKLPVVGAEVIAYGELRGKFYQQGAIIFEIRASDARPVIVFDRVGDAVSAEQRQTFRVSVALSGIVANIGDERNCQVVDLSPEGLGVVSGRELKLGSLIPVSMMVEGQPIANAARVQTAIKRPDGKFRYGLLIPDKKSPARKALERASSSFQRQQLRRLSGAA